MGAFCLLLLPPTLNAGNYTRCTTNYYEVTGTTLSEIRRSMARNRPAAVEREALTEWNVRTRFGAAKFKGGYRCGGFTTTTTIRITVPRWTAPEEAVTSVRESWERYMQALMEHELGHARFALTTAAELHRRVETLGIDPDPDHLKSQVEAVVLQTIEEIRERERAYDRLTRHGMEQGAALTFSEHGSARQIPQDAPNRRHGTRWAERRHAHPTR